MEGLQDGAIQDMKFLPRVIALLAFAGLLIGCYMFAVGFNASARGEMERRDGLSTLPAKSEYIRRLYEQPLGTDALATVKSAEILRHAQQPVPAQLLEKFFAYCAAQRFLGQDESCSALTVRAAIDNASKLSSDLEWPVSGPLESQIAGALSFSLPDEAAMRGSVSERNWDRVSYDDRGVLHDRDNAYLAVAARNLSNWKLRDIRLRAWIYTSASIAVGVECTSDHYFPFDRIEVLNPQEEAALYCMVPRQLERREALVAASRSSRDKDVLPVSVRGFALEDSGVLVAGRGEGSDHRYVISVDSNLAHWPRAARFGWYGVGRELGALDCHETATCLSAFESASIALSGFFVRALALMPVAAGVLMGMFIGGLSRRPYRFGTMLGAGVLLVVIAICAIGFASTGGGGNGFALQGLGVLVLGSIVALPLLLLGMFVGVAVVRLLGKWTAAR